MFASELSDWVLHGVVCCTTRNSSQHEMLRDALTTYESLDGRLCNMQEITRIHASKQPHRPHYIPQWAEYRRMKANDIVREIGADKGNVSRWFKGATPNEEWQNKLAALFAIEDGDRDALFNPPEEYWMKKLFSRHKRLAAILSSMNEDDLNRAENVILAAFPQMAGMT